MEKLSESMKKILLAGIGAAACAAFFVLGLGAANIVPIAFAAAGHQKEMPQEDRIDICYEEFCKDPLRYVETIYRHLGLGGFEEARPYFEKYLDSQKDYQKNHFTLDPKLRDKINSRLGFYFDYYGYEMITE